MNFLIDFDPKIAYFKYFNVLYMCLLVYRNNH